MGVRKAGTKDIPFLEELYRELLPDCDVAVDEKVIGKIASMPEYYLLVYEEGQEVLGSLLLIICYDPCFRDKNFGVIENVIVRSSCRGKGIGEKLMHEADRIAEENNCLYNMLLSRRHRVEAHRFYEKCGYNGSISLGFKKYLGIVQGGPV